MYAVQRRGASCSRLAGDRELAADGLELAEWFYKTIKAHGGRRLEIGHLFEVKQDAKSGEVSLGFKEQSLRPFEQFLLLADRHSPKLKYLVALALGIPIVSQ